jgi:hypothetical protein
MTDGATPTFDEIIGSGTLEELKNLKPASNTKLTAHPELLFKGKKGVVIPPFLTKILMDVDSEDPFVLLKACCKVLKDFDETPEMVEAMDEDEDDAGEQPVSATMTFFHVVQFLYFAARE